MLPVERRGQANGRILGFRPTAAHRNNIPEYVPVSAGGSVKTPVAVQLLLPEMGGVTGFYEARTDRVLCARCAGTPTLAGTPIPEPDCGDLHCSRCRKPLRPVNRRDEPNAAPGLFA